MANEDDLKELDEETQKLINKYVITYATILKILQQQINQGLNERESQRLLKRIKRHLKKLDVEALKYVKEVFPLYYFIALENFDKIAVTLDGVHIVEGAEHAIHKQALKKAQNDLYKDLARRTAHMSQQAKEIIRDNAKELLTAMIEQGTSYKSIKKELKEKLVNDGVSSFVDAKRRTWTIDRYVDMAVRTKSRILHNEGTINRLKEYQENQSEYNESFDLIQISNHNSPCWCGYYEDMVFSISGKSDKYPSIETLPNRPYHNLHPNCRHIWLPYVSSLKGEGRVVDKKYQNLNVKEISKMHYHATKDK
jgi:hypothetical protein